VIITTVIIITILTVIIITMLTVIIIIIAIIHSSNQLKDQTIYSTSFKTTFTCKMFEVPD